jgi:hypothetical protein
MKAKSSIAARDPAPIAGEGDRVRGHVVDESAHGLVYRRAPGRVDLGLVEGDRLLGGLVDRRPGQLVKDQVPLAVFVGEPEQVELAQGLIGVRQINQRDPLGPR